MIDLEGWGGLTRRLKNYGAFLIGVAVLIAGLLVVDAIWRAAYARDYGQWEATDADVSRWFRNLMQPDVPGVSCCGAADAWYADSFKVKEVDGKRRVFAIVTDTRDDVALGRRHIDPGTEVEVPDHKLKWDDGNPTGHGVIFLGSSGQVFCYVAPGGV